MLLTVRLECADGAVPEDPSAPPAGFLNLFFKMLFMLYSLREGAGLDGKHGMMQSSSFMTNEQRRKGLQARRNKQDAISKEEIEPRWPLLLNKKRKRNSHLPCPAKLIASAHYGSEMTLLKDTPTSHSSNADRAKVH